MVLSDKRITMVYILLDGVGDLPSPKLDGLTPLEASITPAMDTFTRNGCMGEVITVGKGIAPQSDIAVFNMLGYDFKDEAYVGRGVIESIGCGIDFRKGDLALRGNFATIGDDMQIVDRRAGRNISLEEAKAYCDTLTNNIRFSDPNISVVIKPAIGHRLVVRFRHNKLELSEKVTNTDPAYIKVNGIGVAISSPNTRSIAECQPLDNTSEAKNSSLLINDFSQQTISLLRKHPMNLRRIREGKKSVNCILLRDAGNRFPELQPIGVKYGMPVASVVDMPVEIGISRVLNMAILETGKPTDYEKKARIISENLPMYGLIYTHIKGPDEYGHDGDSIGKKRNIEEIDRSFFTQLLNRINGREVTVVISADHSTPCTKQAHTEDLVPLLISGNKVRKDLTERFTEKDGAKGSIGIVYGKDVLKTALGLISYI